MGAGSRGVRGTVGRLSAGWAEPRRVDRMLASRTTAGSSGVRHRGVNWTLKSRTSAGSLGRAWQDGWGRRTRESVGGASRG